MSGTDASQTIRRMRGNVPGMAWPAVNVGNSAALASMCAVLDQTQWMSGEDLRKRQFVQLAELARHLGQFSEHFRRRLSAAGLEANELCTQDALARMKPFGRRDIQSAGERLYCTQVPEQHRPVGDTKTTGSTGEPVTLRRTAISLLIWMADNIRDHLWHGRDFKRRFTAIRSQVEKYEVRDNWGPPISLLFDSGPFQAVPMGASIEQQWEWMNEFQTEILLVHPSNLDGLLTHCRGSGLKLASLKQIRTIGEMLPRETREAAREYFGAQIADCYSSQEVGTIAIECPRGGLYHVCAEHVIVEILDEQDQACRDGEIGRVILTDISNFATPLVRYDIGDYAELGPPCPCGRGLPTLRRVVGRQRNLMVMPDGTRNWPILGTIKFRDVAPVRQFQFVQLDREQIEVRLVVESPLTPGIELRLTEMIRKALKHTFQLNYVYYADRIPRSPGGKFEEFVSKCT